MCYFLYPHKLRCKGTKKNAYIQEKSKLFSLKTIDLG